MSHRVAAALLSVFAFLATSCGGTPHSGDAEAVADAVEIPALFGVERNLDDGARRVDTTIDPDQLEPPLPPEPKIGDLTIPCGPASQVLSNGVTPGVTIDSITIGTGSDRGGLYSFGSGTEIPDTVRALADRCNALGGVNGRRIEVIEHDAAVVEIEDQIRAACESDFALVGHGYLLDDSVEPLRAACGIPAFPAWTTTRPDGDSRLIAAIPSQPEQVVLDGLALAVSAAAEAGSRVGVVVPATTGGRDAAARLQAAVLAAGMDVETSVFEYGIDRPPGWEAIVGSARAEAIGVLWVEGSCDSTLVPLLEAARAAGWDPEVVGPSGLYDPQCVSLNPDAVSGVLLTLAVHPIEERDEVEAVDAHVQLLRAAGIAPTADALRAASAFWLWASAASECSEPLTRACVVAAAEAVNDWTAGGLHPPTDPGSWTDSGCFVLVSAVDGAFQRMSGSPGDMNCDPDVRVQIG
jgi:ABC-type branched-subunit amino acid transport system substrate-binding protein